MTVTQVPRGTLTLKRALHRDELFSPIIGAKITAIRHNAARNIRTQRLRTDRSCMPLLKSGVPVWYYIHR